MTHNAQLPRASANDRWQVGQPIPSHWLTIPMVTTGSELPAPTPHDMASDLSPTSTMTPAAGSAILGERPAPVEVMPPTVVLSEASPAVIPAVAVTMETANAEVATLTKRVDPLVAAWRSTSSTIREQLSHWRPVGSWKSSLLVVASVVLVVWLIRHSGAPQPSESPFGSPSAGRHNRETRVARTQLRLPAARDGQRSAPVAATPASAQPITMPSSPAERATDEDIFRVPLLGRANSSERESTPAAAPARPVDAGHSKPNGPSFTTPDGKTLSRQYTSKPLPWPDRSPSSETAHADTAPSRVAPSSRPTAPRSEEIEAEDSSVATASADERDERPRYESTDPSSHTDPPYEVSELPRRSSRWTR